eukprot:699256-Prymnesium_polylepis.1
MKGSGTWSTLNRSCGRYLPHFERPRWHHRTSGSAAVAASSSSLARLRGERRSGGGSSSSVAPGSGACGLACTP